MMWWRRLLLLVAIAGLPRVVTAAGLSINPGAAQTGVGSVITTTIEVNTVGAAINAVEATLIFPTKLLHLIAVSKSGSILPLVTIDSTTANTTGQVSFSGGLPSPGYTGEQGTILKLTWEAQAAGQAILNLTDGKVLANDGEGTNVLDHQTGSVFTIAAAEPNSLITSPPVVGSLDYTNELNWYSQSTTTIFWTNPVDLTGVSYAVDRSPSTVPDTTIETTENSVTIPLVEDGIWYFHLRGQYGSRWSDPVHFTLRHDATPPEPFELEVRRDRGVADPSPSIVFSTLDQSSGLAGYSATVDDATTQSVTSPLRIIATRSGDYQVVVTATDRAGNIQVSATTFSVAGYTVPVITAVSTPLILLGKLSVRGTALAGDRVNIFVDGNLIGSTTAGPATLAVNDGTTVRLPWVFTTDQPFGPGEHRVTATATSPTGQTSIASDPRLLEVRGSRIQIGGWTIASVAAAPLFGFIIVLAMMALTWLVWQLRQSLHQFELRQTMVDQDLRVLRRAVDQGQLTTRGIAEAITMIDDEVVGRRPRSTRPASSANRGESRRSVKKKTS